MRVGFDIQCAMHRNGTGLHSHLTLLVHALHTIVEEPLRLFCVGGRYGKLGSEDVQWAREVFRTRHVQLVVPPARFYRAWHYLTGCNRVDVLCHNLHGMLPLSSRGANAFLIPDIIPLRLDYGTPAFRDNYVPFYEKAVRHGDVLIVSSQHTKSDVVGEFQVEPRKICVAPLAAAEQFHAQADRPVDAETLQRLGLGQSPYVLCVSTLEERKNHAVLLKAFARTVSRDPALPHRLVLVGGKWPGHDQPVFELIERLGLSDRVSYLGYAGALDVLYRAAAVMVFPSLYEGFGLPPLEAMACGTPVLVSDATSLPEVVGDGGQLFEPHDELELAEKLYRMLTDQPYRAEWARRARTRSQQFSWRRTAELYLAAFQQAVGARAARRTPFHARGSASTP